MNIFLFILLYQVGIVKGVNLGEDIFGHDVEKSPANFKAFQHVSRLVLSSSMEQIVIITDNTTVTFRHSYEENSFVQLVPALSQLLLSSSMKDIIVLSDNRTETNVLVTMVTEVTVTSMCFVKIDVFISAVRSLIRELLRVQSTDWLWQHLNLIVICDVDCINAAINNTHMLDIAVGKRSVLRHFSKWILVPTAGDIRELPTLNITFDNVNAIIKDALEIAVLSLLWTARGREWKVLDKNVTSPETAFPNIRHGLNGRTLLVASLEWLPYTKRDIANGKPEYTGVSAEILDRLALIFNFSIEYVEPADQQWGYQANSTWTGIIGMVYREEVDMCGVPYAENIQRHEVMTFSYPIMYDYHSAVYKKSADESQQWTRLTSCFKGEVYLCGLTALLFVIFLFILLEKAVACRQPVKRSGNYRNTLDIAFQSVTAPLHQGTASQSKSMPFNILLSFWWFFCIVITCIYTRNLIAFLTVSKDQVPFRTLEDIGQQDAYEVGVLMSGSYLEIQLKHSNDSLLKGLLGKINRFTKPGSSDEEWRYHINKLFDGHYVFLLNLLGIDVLMADTCDLSLIDERFMPMHGSFTFPKLSPLSELFSGELTDMVENGLIETWYRRLSQKRKLCTKSSQRNNVQLELKDLSSALVVCAMGIVFALIALLLEHFIRRLMKY